MIAQWIAYSVAISSLLALAALALEHAFGRRGLPLRAVWAAALAGSAICSVLPSIMPPHGVANPKVVEQLITSPAAGAPIPATTRVDRPGTLAAPAGDPVIRLGDGNLELARFDGPLRLIWLLASGLVAIGIGLSARTLRRERRSWTRGVIKGMPAYISDDFGPAVVGFFRAMIVVPRWVLAMTPRERCLVIAHELEHLRRGDPRLVALGLLTAVAMPWNPAIWWQIRRLRHAIELDCDARVLRRCPDARSYGSLLIELARRRPTGSIPIAAFAESSSFLERRIELILAPSRHAGTLSRLATACMATVLVAAALQVPRPVVAQAGAEASALPMDPKAVPEFSVAAVPAAEATGALPGPANALGLDDDSANPAFQRLSSAPVDTLQARFQPEDLAALVRQEYPATLRKAGVEGEATLRFRVDREGRAREVEVLAQDRLEFAEAAERVVEQLVFWPARVDGEAIESAVPHFRVRFRLAMEPAAERREPGSVEIMLRAAISEYYPQLLREASARTPYVYFVVNERGDVVRHALDWSRPATPVIRDAILDRFPDLPRARSAVPGGAGSSVRTGIPGGEDIEVFWAALAEPTAAEAPIAWGDYPLAAVSPGRGFPHTALLQSIRQRHEATLRENVPAGTAIWYVASASGEILETGVATDSAAYARLSEFDQRSAFMFMSFLDTANGQRVRVSGVILEPRPAEQGVLAGRVFDAAGNPVAGAIVMFRDRVQGAVTRGSGEYRLIGVPAGRHALIVRHPTGSPEVTGEVILSEEAGGTADFTFP